MQKVELMIKTSDVQKIKELAEQLHGAGNLGLAQSCQVVLSAYLDGRLVQKKTRSKPSPKKEDQED